MEPGPSETRVIERPLLQLIIQLTSNHKSATLLRNSTVINILNEEFNMNTYSMEHIEVAIYVNIIKRFIMDWPHWDSFELIVSDLKAKNNQQSLKDTVKREYQKLKTYLSEILKQSEPIIKEKIESDEPCQNVKEETSRVVMEISCTRVQLNTLVFRTPCGPKKTIFNGSNPTPNRIVYFKTPFRSILNWFDVELMINTQFFSYTRSNVHTLTHNLINKKVVGDTIKKVVLDDNIKENSSSKITVDTESLLNFLHKFKEKLLNLYKDKHHTEMIELVMDLLSRDIRILNMRKIHIQGKYKFSLSKYGYIRYLYKETGENSSKYDIQLEESVSPTNIILINRFTAIANIPAVANYWLQIKCTLCNVNFNIESIDNLVMHFMEKHSHEPDWRCTNCLRIFSMINLTEKDWYHECLS